MTAGFTPSPYLYVSGEKKVLNIEKFIVGTARLADEHCPCVFSGHLSTDVV